MYTYFIYSSEDGNHKADEAEEVRSGDEEDVEPEEEPEGTIRLILFILNEILQVTLFLSIFFISSLAFFKN